VNGRWVRAGGRHAARPSDGIKPAKGAHLKPHERRRVRGVESDTVTRVTHTGRDLLCRRFGRDHGTETQEGFATLKGARPAPRDPHQWVAERRPKGSGRRMTHSGIRRGSMQRRVEDGGAVRSKRAAWICAESTGSACSQAQRENRRDEQASPMRGCTAPRADGHTRHEGQCHAVPRDGAQGEGGRMTPVNVGAGQPTRWRLAAFARRGMRQR
jgi:hypothetical protein